MCIFISLLKMSQCDFEVLTNDFDLLQGSCYDPLFSFDIDDFLQPAQEYSNYQSNDNRQIMPVTPYNLNNFENVKEKTLENFEKSQSKSLGYFPEDALTHFANGSEHMNLFSRIMLQENPQFQENLRKYIHKIHDEKIQQPLLCLK